MKIDSQLKEAYFSEASQHLKVMNTSLLALEKEPKETGPLTDLKNAVHTLKSMSATMQYEKTAALCHAMEDALEAVIGRSTPDNRKKIASQILSDEQEQLIELLFECFDVLEASISALEKGDEELETTELVDSLVEMPNTDRRSKSSDRRKTKEDRRTERQDIIASDSIQVKVDRLDTLMKLAEEMLIAKMRLDRLKDEQEENIELASAVDSLSRLVTDMQYHITQARMVPIGMIFDRFPRMVRDLSKQEKKVVNLVMEGNEIELDRQVLGQVGEPLVHLLRNAIDHGIETPEIRKKKGKPAEATIKLRARRERGLVLIEVKDDGDGLDIEAIKNVAIKKGLIASGASPDEVMKVLFSGLSTSQKVTTVSGRGLGLGIVKKAMDTMGGSIKVESVPGESTKFTIELPLTLAIVNTLFVKVADGTYAIPVNNVVRMLTVRDQEIKGQFGTEAFLLDGEDLPLVSLRSLFHLEAVMPESVKAKSKKPDPENDRQGEESQIQDSDSSVGTTGTSRASREVVIVRKGDEKFGLGVDSFVATQEIVIKPLDRMVRANKYFSGSTIIGSGDAVLVLDVGNLAILKKRDARGAKRDA